MTERLRLRSLNAALLVGLALTLVGCGGGDSKPIPPDPVIVPPGCRLQPIPSPVFGTLPVRYDAIDALSNLVDLRPEFSENGGATWSVATSGLGGDGTTDLTTSPAGTPHVFAWDLITDFPTAAGSAVNGVLLRFGLSVPDGAAGIPCTSNPFTVFGTPDRIQIGSISTGLARVDVAVPISVTTSLAAGGAIFHLQIDLEFDPTLLTVTSVRPGAAAPSATVMLTPLAAGRIRVNVDSSSVPLGAGEVVVLLASTPCVAPVSLPTSSDISCIAATATDAIGNGVAVLCGIPGLITVVDNSSRIAVADGTFSTGATGALLPVVHTSGLPPAGASTLSFSLTWSPIELDIVGASAGAALAPGGMVNWNPLGGGTAILTVTNPLGTAFADGTVANLILDILAPAPSSAVIDLAGLALSSDRCLALPGLLDPDARIQVIGQRTLTSLMATSSLGARGTPALVAGSITPRNPRGNWFPLNTGQLSPEVRLVAGGNPVIFFSLTDPGFQIVLEAGWAAAPMTTDVAPATSADGATTYAALSGAGNVQISSSGLLTPQFGNSCTVFRATFTPNGVTGFGAPQAVDFSACVDLGGIDGATRASGLLPAGALDADLPGLPLGDPIPGVGGSLDATVYMNTGGLPIGSYDIITLWDAARLDLVRTVGLTGYLPPSDATLGGPTGVDAATPGESIGSNLVTAAGYSGIFDIWTLRIRALSSGTTTLNHAVIRMDSSDMPAIPIGGSAPRSSIEASMASLQIP